MTACDVTRLPGGLLLGTSSFSSPDWRGTFYPESMPPQEFLSFYASQLRTVEIDASFYAMPPRRTMESWARKVPDGFVFALKTPRSITHDRYLEGCKEEWERFVDLTRLLGSKRGPILLQFSYVSRAKDPEEYGTGADFRRRLEAFLPLIPPDGQFVVEVRNRAWLNPELMDLLRPRGIAVALVNYYTMPGPEEMLRRMDPPTADFAYVRFLGNHRAMDQRVAQAREDGIRSSDWGELMVDRTEDLREWVRHIGQWLDRVPRVYAYFNNHYAGFAPGSLDLFVRLWQEVHGPAGA